jgi:hypothetical protein
MVGLLLGICAIQYGGMDVTMGAGAMVGVSAVLGLVGWCAGWYAAKMF